MSKLIRHGEEYILSDENPSKETGICSTCVNVSSCGYVSLSDKPVWECEEYDNGSQKATFKIIKILETDAQTISKPEDNADQPEAEYKGLCVNCDNRKSCCYKNRVGGIWHCENYE